MFKSVCKYIMFSCCILSSVLSFAESYEDLDEAFFKEDVTKIKELLKNESVKKEINKPGVYGQTLLHRASELNLHQIMEALLDAGADHTLLDEDKQTALDVAIISKALDSVKVLLRRYPYLIYQRDVITNGTPLNNAVHFGEDNMPIVRLLVEQYNAPIAEEDIQAARQHGYQDMQRYLEEQRAIQQRNFTGRAVNLVAAGRERARQAVGGLGSYLASWLPGGSR